TAADCNANGVVDAAESFRGQVLFDVPRTIFALATADFDGDGLLDHVFGTLDLTAPGGPSTLVLRRATPTGFAPPVDIPVPGQSGYRSLGVGDFDGDGAIDLVAGLRLGSSSNDASVQLLWGAGDGTFTLDPSPFPFADPQEIAVRDFDSDGDLDFAVLSPAWSSVTVGVYLNDGAGAFTPTILVEPNEPDDFAVGDLDEDGFVDILLLDRPNDQLRVLLGQPGGSFSGPFTHPGIENNDGVTVIDVDRDGHLDVVCGQTPSEQDTVSYDLCVWLGDGAGGLSAPQAIPSSIRVDRTAAVDVNGDGAEELIALEGFRTGWTIASTGTTGLTEVHTTRWSPSTLSYLGTADADGDGRDELYAYRRPDGALVRWQSAVEDCNLNFVPDACDLLQPGFDSDGDGIVDECSSTFRRGDVDGDTIVDVDDVIALLDELFLDGPVTPCRDAGDANDDGERDVADAIAIISYLFVGGATLPDPTNCGVDPTVDGLDCASPSCP
ncbi:MAG: VCBS repeat-containing protein, partial [Planctomycetes bacterium]|nr:VCBS repeat-containing protein [Planctomycetota bacterium]